MKKYWSIRQVSRTLEDNIFVNGAVDVSTNLPYCPCPQCGNNWMSLRQFPFKCPPSIREEIELIKSQTLSFSFEAFVQRAERWEGILENEGHRLSEFPVEPVMEFSSRFPGSPDRLQLQPGDQFLPIHWSVPTIPRSDLYFPFGISQIVSEKMFQQCAMNNTSGIRFSKLTLDNVGKIEPSDFKKFPSKMRRVPFNVGSPEYFKKVSTLRNPESCGTFYLATVLNYRKLGDTQGINVLKKCVCGRTKMEEKTWYQKRVDYLLKHGLIPESERCDVEIFRSHIFGLVVSDRIMRFLDGLDLTNCQLTELEPCQAEPNWET